jgi:hypothetical protein
MGVRPFARPNDMGSTRATQCRGMRRSHNSRFLGTLFLPALSRKRLDGRDESRLEKSTRHDIGLFKPSFTSHDAASPCALRFSAQSNLFNRKRTRRAAESAFFIRRGAAAASHVATSRAALPSAHHVRRLRYPPVGRRRRVRRPQASGALPFLRRSPRVVQTTRSRGELSPASTHTRASRASEATIKFRRVAHLSPSLPPHLDRPRPLAPRPPSTPAAASSPRRRRRQRRRRRRRRRPL